MNTETVNTKTTTSKTALLFTHGANRIGSLDAYNRCLAELEAPERASCKEYDNIFFYFGSVNILKESRYFSLWQHLKETFNVHLIACSTVATKKAIDAADTGPFELAGLSEFYSRLHHCDELVQL